MSLLKKYKKYQEGVVIYGTTQKMQEFFKTKPTEKQIMILDDINDQSIILTILLLALYLGMGIMIGFIVGVRMLV